MCYGFLNHLTMMSKNILFFIIFFVTCSHAAQGLTGRYYDEQNFTTYQGSQTDATINFNWGYDRPALLTGNDNFSIIWTGYVYIPEDATYTFSYANDDNFELTVNGILLANDTSWSGGEYVFDDATPIALSTGYYPIQIRFAEGGGGAYAKLAWRNSGSITTEVIVPTTNLFTELPITCVTYDTTDSADSCQGTTISVLDGITSNTTACITGSSPDGDKDYYKFTVGTSGTLNITTSSPNSHNFHLMIGSTCDGAQYYPDTTAQSHVISPLSLNPNETVYIYIKETGDNTDNYKLNFNFTVSTPSVSIQNASLIEGDANETTYFLPVTLDKYPTNTVTVNYTTINGSAKVEDNDYNASSGTLTFDTSTLTQNIPITIQGDTLDEGAETFTIQLSNITGFAHFANDTATITITNDDIPPNFCTSNSLSNGFHIVNPFNDINKSIEIYCYDNKDYVALPIKNDSNNFVFNDNALASINYYTEANTHANHFDAIEINAYTLKVISDSSIRLPQTVNASTSFKTMGSSFSNINLTGTPFAIDWANTTISNCTPAKLRKAYYGQDVKINTLDYDAKAICNIDSMQLKLLDDYRYLEYEGNEVLTKSCKTMAEAVPTSFLDSASIQGHYWISPFSRTRSYEVSNIKANERPIVVYCWYQTDLDWVWTFSLAMDGKVTNKKADLINKTDTCSEFGLVPFVANKEDTFERVRAFLYGKKTEWVNYTGTINEKFRVFNNNSNYYLASEYNSIIWPYGSFGVYFPYNGDHTKTNVSQEWGGSNNADPGPMSGSPMHNISTITTDYVRLNNDENNTNRDYYSWGLNRAELDITEAQTAYSDLDTVLNDASYPYEATMGAKGWVSILGAADLNKTNEWFISRTGAGANFDHSSPSHPYYEPNGNYTAGAWLNFLFDSNGRVRHNDDLDAAYSYYDYMCMAEDNYDFTTRYGLIEGPFKAIERSVASGTEASNLSLKTKIVNDTLMFDIAILNDALSAIADKNVSVGIFMNDTYMVGATETPKDIHYFGDIKLDNTGTFNTLKTLGGGRFALPDSTWPSATPKWTKANKRLFFKFKYCSRSDYEWTQCWTRSGNTATCTAGQEAYCRSVDSNDFAVRPKNFDFDISGTSPYKAGVGYDVSFSAKDFLNNNTADFNQSVPFAHVETLSGCLTGDYNASLTTVPLINGSNTMNLAYSEVGIINVKMQETLGSEFALVDASDTPNSERLITPYDQNWSYTPDHFSLAGSTFSNNANGFTYLSTDLNISADLNLTITAQTLSNTTTQNYNSACYAKTTNYAISYTPLTLSPTTALSRLNFLESNTSISGNFALNNTLSLASIPDTIFTTDANGTGTLNIKLNFDRNASLVVNPFNLTIQDANVSDTDGIDGNITLNQAARFYYGRAHAPDYRFANRDGNATIYYEVYCKDCNATFRNTMGITGNESVNALNWYQNALHVNTSGIVTPQPAHSADFTTFSTTHPDPVSVERLTLKSTTDIPYVDRVNLNSNTWLVHYPTYFTVEFYSTGSWAGAGFVKENQPNATDTNTTVGEHIHKSAPTKAHKRLNW